MKPKKSRTGKSREKHKSAHPSETIIIKSELNKNTDKDLQSFVSSADPSVLNANQLRELKSILTAIYPFKNEKNTKSDKKQIDLLKAPEIVETILPADGIKNAFY